jgi:hypothetical protein
MLKRKANEFHIPTADESDDNVISTKQEITQRKIFRAKRPVRSLSPNPSSNFKLASQLVNLEEEVRLLSLDNKPKPAAGSLHHRTRSENPYGLAQFCLYSSKDPLRDIIQNFSTTNESQQMKGFLDSSLDKTDKIVKISVDCLFYTEENATKALCSILCLRDKSVSFLLIKDKNDSVLFQKTISKDMVCKELQSGHSSVIQVSYTRAKSQEIVKLEMSRVSKHLFLRCFSECKLQSF